MSKLFMNFFTNVYNQRESFIYLNLMVKNRKIPTEIYLNSYLPIFNY
jgi:hypothetical protein